MAHVCPPGAHPHLVLRPVSIFGGYAVAGSTAPGLIIATDETAARRVCELLDRHGLVDVPDDVASLTAWPPPAGLRFVAPRPGMPLRPSQVRP